MGISVVQHDSCRNKAAYQAPDTTGRRVTGGNDHEDNDEDVNTPCESVPEGERRRIDNDEDSRSRNVAAQGGEGQRMTTTPPQINKAASALRPYSHCTHKQITPTQFTCMQAP